MTQSQPLKILVLGGKNVGKSAVVVRFLTKRYIGEYRSNIDWLYKQTVLWDDTASNVEILDISKLSDESSTPVDQIVWADGFVIVYNICDRASFNYAHACLEMIYKVRMLSYVPVVLFGNKRDLELAREVELEEGHELAIQYGCHFYEISAAENFLDITHTFQTLIREIKNLSHSNNRSSLPRQRKLSMVSVSKVFGAMFGKGNAKSKKNRQAISL